MIIEYCHTCDEMIDTDYNAEHFDECEYNSIKHHKNCSNSGELIRPKQKRAMCADCLTRV